MQMRTSGGAMDTEVNELMVKPWGVPSLARTVATATPVANSAQARRNSSGGNDGGLLDKGLTLILS